MADNFDVWLGSELGLLKGVEIQRAIVTNFGQLTKLTDKLQEICSLSWADEKEEKIAVGLKNGTVKTFDSSTQRYEEDILNCECGENARENAVRGIGFYNGWLVSSTADGSLNIWKDGKNILNKSIGAIEKMKQNPSYKQQICTGGKENELKMWDLENMEVPLFRAKNVRNDFLNLRVPVWITDIGFSQDIKEHAKIVVGTGHHQVRIYDPRSQRRPMVDVEWHEHPITAVSVTNDNNCVIVGNSAGHMASLDLRTCKQVGVFKGFAGGIRSIHCHSSQQYVASCGLDRFLRVHNIQTRELVSKVYLKSRLSSLLLKSADIFESSSIDNGLKEDSKFLKRKIEQDGDSDQNEDDEDLWDGMDIVKDRKHIKKGKKTKT